MLLELFKVEGTILDRLRVGKRPVHSFGRNSELCTHALDHGSISRQHALIVHTQHGPYLVDLHSSQGTRVNGEKVEAGGARRPLRRRRPLLRRQRPQVPRQGQRTHSRRRQQRRGEDRSLPPCVRPGRVAQAAARGR